jgi:hypothetical protein
MFPYRMGVDVRRTRFMFVLKWKLPRGNATVKLTESEADSFLVNCNFRTS